MNFCRGRGSRPCAEATAAATVPPEPAAERRTGGCPGAHFPVDRGERNRSSAAGMQRRTSDECGGALSRRAECAWRSREPAHFPEAGCGRRARPRARPANPAKAMVQVGSQASPELRTIPRSGGSTELHPTIPIMTRLSPLVLKGSRGAEGPLSTFKAQIQCCSISISSVLPRYSYRSSAMGTLPFFQTKSWKSRRLNLSPCARRASASSFMICSLPVW